MKNPTKVKTRQFKCDVCGANQEFNPRNLTLDCQSCARQETITQPPENWKPIAQDLVYAVDSGLTDLEHERISLLAHCDNCGADVEFDPNIHADNCVYCDSAVVAVTSGYHPIKAHAIIPFAVSKDDARALIRAWLKQQYFTPAALRAYNTSKEIHGIYVPYWAYDAHVENNRVLGNYIDPTGFEWQFEDDTPANNERRFENVLVPASQNLPTDFIINLGPWIIQKLVPYEEAYLAGFRASAYNIDLKTGFAQAIELFKPTLAHEARMADILTIGAAPKIKLARYKLIMLPIYSAPYRYRGKSYQLFINGQTGNVIGQKPFPSGLIFSIIVAMLAVITTIALALG